MTSEYKIKVEYKDPSNELILRYTWVDVREISGIDEWDSICDEQGYTSIMFKDATELYVTRESYLKLLELWMQM